ncbi:hypothetical protein [Lysobacter sp. F6437]|uniref:hypothetical protein n=1 Tax=Lysobacter sp. F6437 TaxID=3459296 RepID=UPI00403D9E46
MTIAILALLAALVTTTTAHISYKRYAIDRRRMDLYLTIVLFVSTTPLTYLAIKSFGIGLVYVCTSINYIAAAVAGRYLFGERLTRRSIAAMLLIAGGTSVYALGYPR